MLLAALRRFLLLTTAVVVTTGALSLLIGAGLGASAGRAVSLGFYAIGSFALLAGVFVGSRGPVRLKSEETSPGMWGLPFFGIFGNRQLRWATLGEQHETINNSAVWVAVGLVLLMIGILLDPRHRLY
jgi:uncharacterized membrane protein YczE